MIFDVIVAGLGAIGSSTLYQLSKRNSNILGIDQFNPPHEKGSSHGDTRITRLAIGEGEAYTPLAIKSHKLWQDLERLKNTKLFVQNGFLMLFANANKSCNYKGVDFLKNTLEIAKSFKIEHEILSSHDIMQRFPQFKNEIFECGYFEKESGYLFPVECIRVQLELARLNNAKIASNEKILKISKSKSLLTVTTNKASYTTKQLIVTAGSWINQLLEKEFKNYFKIYRQVLYWFDVSSVYKNFLDNKFPTFGLFREEDNEVTKFCYGFPAINGLNGGFKIATEQYVNECDPDKVDRTVSTDEIKEMYNEHIEPNFKDISPNCLKSKTCLYTVTPDGNFVIDKHPENEDILIVSPCSGHGFKHSAALGEAISELVLDGESKIDLSSFRLDRFK